MSERATRPTSPPLDKGRSRARLGLAAAGAAWSARDVNRPNVAMSLIPQIDCSPAPGLGTANDRPIDVANGRAEPRQEPVRKA
jgi:hypothetical protein